MQAVGKIGSYISKGVYIVSGPFHPFGGAVDIIVVEQPDGTFKSCPWYVRFGKFQGVLKTREKIVNVCVNGVEADFHMYLNHKGEAYFLREVVEQQEGESLRIHPSGTETGGQVQGHGSGWQVTSKGFNFDGLSSADVGTVNPMARSDLQQSRVAELVSRWGSMGADKYQEQEANSCVEGRLSVEHAEIAAELLDLKWSMDCLSRKCKEEDSPSFASDTSESITVDLNHEKSGENLVAQDKFEKISRNDQLHKEDASCNASALFAGNMECVVEDVSGEFMGLNGFAEGVATSAGGHGISENENLTKKVAPLNHESSDSLESGLDDSTEQCSRIMYNDSGETGDFHPDTVQISNNTTSEELVRVDLEDAAILQETDGTYYTGIRDGYVNRRDSPNICDVSKFNSKVCQADENSSRDNACSSEIQLTSQSISNTDKSHCDCFLKKATNLPPVDNLEGRHLFSNADGLKLSEDTPVADKESCLSSCPGFSSEQVSVPVCAKSESFMSSDTLVQEIPSIDSQDDKSKTKSAAIKMPRSQKVDGRKGGLLGQSLPDIVSYFEDSDAKTCHYPRSNSLNLNLASLDKSMLNGALSSGMKVHAGNGTELAKEQNHIQHSQCLGASNDVTVDLEVDEDKMLKPKCAKKTFRTITPTSEQLASLKLREGSNTVDARIFLWKWNARIIISDVDGTITKSDVLGQFMPMVGVDWSHTGVARLFSAIKENGYQLLFLSARSISQAYLTRQFLFNINQDGMALPNGPVVISPDGLFPSLFREVVRRCPHEFKIACLEDIKILFPSDCNPFYAGFGNRDTDEISYLKVGIPKGKIFIINPKGEVAVNRHVEKKSYTSIHALVNGMFPPVTSPEQEDFNSWNFWKLPPPAIDM